MGHNPGHTLVFFINVFFVLFFFYLGCSKKNLCVWEEREFVAVWAHLQKLNGCQHSGADLLLCEGDLHISSASGRGFLMHKGTKLLASVPLEKRKQTGALCMSTGDLWKDGIS